MDEQLKQLHADIPSEVCRVSATSSPRSQELDSASTLSNPAVRNPALENQLFVVQRLETSNLMPVEACAHSMLRPCIIQTRNSVTKYVCTFIHDYTCIHVLRLRAREPESDARLGLAHEFRVKQESITRVCGAHRTRTPKLQAKADFRELSVSPLL